MEEVGRGHAVMLDREAGTSPSRSWESAESGRDPAARRGPKPLAPGRGSSGSSGDALTDGGWGSRAAAVRGTRADGGSTSPPTAVRGTRADGGSRDAGGRRFDVAADGGSGDAGGRRFDVAADGGSGDAGGRRFDVAADGGSRDAGGRRFDVAADGILVCHKSETVLTVNNSLQPRFRFGRPPHRPANHARTTRDPAAPPRPPPNRPLSPYSAARRRCR